jgi:hypothetical protein
MQEADASQNDADVVAMVESALESEDTADK